MPTTDAAVESLLSDLVRIESVTPWLIADGSGEAELARYIVAWFGDLDNVETSLEEVEPDRPNVIVRLRGAGTGPNLYLNAHADTVGYANWQDRALVPSRDGDRLIGLGAADDKSSCAMGMLALRALAERRTTLRGDLVLACTVDEEGASIGTEHLIAHHQIDAALILEPEGIDKVLIEHQGFGWIDVVVHGRPAHGSDPAQGIDAIVHMAEVVRRLHALDEAGFGHGEGGLNGRTVFHTGTISGGTDYATYPSRCVLGIEIGTQPGEHLSDRVREIETIFDDVRKHFPDFRGEVVVRVDRDPFQAAGHERLLEVLAAATEQVIGRPLESIGLNAWGDSGLTQAAGIPTLSFGALGGNFHTPDEWVSLGEIVQGVEILERAIAAYLG